MIPAVLLRRAVPLDAGALAGLERAAAQHPWSEAQLRAELERRAPDEVLVLESARGVAAYCACRLVLDELHVMSLAVRPEHQRRGLGRFLLEAALRRAALRSARRALLEVRAGNVAARALYSKCGFVELGRRAAYYREPVEDALVLVRDSDARDDGDPPP